ncbi:MAG: EamA family transporter [Lachnospiraceae bacterium]|nr:EamA family transporter [Lachnospiraceae bacterium]
MSANAEREDYENQMSAKAEGEAFEAQISAKAEGEAFEAQVSAKAEGEDHEARISAKAEGEDHEARLSDRTRGAILTIFGGICWGLSGSMGQYLFTREGMDARWLTPIRLFIAGLILFVYCLIREKELLFDIVKHKRTLILLFVYGILGVSFCQLTYFMTIQYSSAGVGTIMQDLSPVMILVMTCIFNKRRPRFLEIASICLAFVGVLLIITHGNLKQLAFPPIAIVTGVLCAMGVCVYNLIAPYLTNHYPVTVLQAWSFLAGGVIVGLVTGGFRIHYSPSPVGIFGIFFVVVVGNILAFTSYIKGVSLIGPSRGILYGFSEPVTAALISTLAFGSAFGFWDLVGFACIFLMLFLISKKKTV